MSKASQGKKLKNLRAETNHFMKELMKILFIPR